MIPLVDLLDRADRNGHLLAPPEVTFLQEHMCHVALRGVDDQALDLADLAVGRVHRLTALNADLSRREHVPGLDRAGQRHLRIGPTLQPEVGPVVGLVRLVGVVATASGEKVGLLGGRELVELGEGVAQADPVAVRLDHLERDQPAEAAAVLRLNDKVGELAGHRVHHDPGHRAAGPVAARRSSPDRERGVCHTGLLRRPRPYWGAAAALDPDAARSPGLPAPEVDVPPIDHLVAVDHIQGVVVRHGGIDVCREHPDPVADPEGRGGSERQVLVRAEPDLGPLRPPGRRGPFPAP